MNLEKEVARLKHLPIGELKAKYAEICGETSNTRNRIWLIRRIAWRLQANLYGDLSERALARAREIASDADIRSTPPKAKPVTVAAHTKTAPLVFAPDSRLPVAGSVITRRYKGRELRVTVCADGFEFEGERYKSLSAVAKHITGSHCNGFLFFGLAKGGKA